MLTVEAAWVRQHVLTPRIVESICGTTRDTTLLGLCACQWGRVFYCTIGHHDRCQHTTNPKGSVFPSPETHILRRNGGATTPVYLTPNPCRYRCSCDCHTRPHAVQPSLFDAAVLAGGTT